MPTVVSWPGRLRRPGQHGTSSPEGQLSPRYEATDPRKRQLYMRGRLQLGLRFRPSSQRGATAAEYAILASLIAVVIIGAVAALGTAVNGLFNSVQIP